MHVHVGRLVDKIISFIVPPAVSSAANLLMKVLLSTFKSGDIPIALSLPRAPFTCTNGLVGLSVKEGGGGRGGKRRGERG